MILLIKGGIKVVNKQYSEKQLKIISGEIPIETIGTKTVNALYKKAIVASSSSLPPILSFVLF